MDKSRRNFLSQSAAAVILASLYPYALRADQKLEKHIITKQAQRQSTLYANVFSDASIDKILKNQVHVNKEFSFQPLSFSKEHKEQTITQNTYEINHTQHLLKNNDGASLSFRPTILIDNKQKAFHFQPNIFASQKIHEKDAPLNRMHQHIRHIAYSQGLEQDFKRFVSSYIGTYLLGGQEALEREFPTISNFGMPSFTDKYIQKELNLLNKLSQEKSTDSETYFSYFKNQKFLNFIIDRPSSNNEGKTRNPTLSRNKQGFAQYKHPLGVFRLVTPDLNKEESAFESITVHYIGFLHLGNISDRLQKKQEFSLNWEIAALQEYIKTLCTNKDMKEEVQTHNHLNAFNNYALEALFAYDNIGYNVNKDKDSPTSFRGQLKQLLESQAYQNNFHLVNPYQVIFPIPIAKQKLTVS